MSATIARIFEKRNGSAGAFFKYLGLALLVERVPTTPSFAE